MFALGASSNGAAQGSDAPMQSIDELVAQRKLLKEAEKAAKASGRVRARR